jgi:hypothetical protein
MPYRELNDAVGLTDIGAEMIADTRTGKNGRHRLAGLLRQSVFGRLAGYEDVNDADRLRRDPAISGSAASASQMGRFETKWLIRPENLGALADLPGQWIDAVHKRRPPKPPKPLTQAPSATCTVTTRPTRGPSPLHRANARARDPRVG